MKTEDLQAIKKRYKDLLIKQYREKPKAEAHIEAFVDLFLQDGAIFNLLNTFDIEKAIGWQLDAIGERVGIDRKYRGLAFKNRIFFAYGIGAVLPTSQYKGYGAGAELGEIANEESVLSREFLLNDDDFRKLIKFRVITNASNHTEYSIENAILETFNNEIKVRSGFMEIIYDVSENASNIVNIALIKGVLPKPRNTKITINII